MGIGSSAASDTGNPPRRGWSSGMCCGPACPLCRLAWQRLERRRQRLGRRRWRPVRPARQGGAQWGGGGWDSGVVQRGGGGPRRSRLWASAASLKPARVAYLRSGRLTARRGHRAGTVDCGTGGPAFRSAAPSERSRRTSCPASSLGRLGGLQACSWQELGGASRCSGSVGRIGPAAITSRSRSLFRRHRSVGAMGR